MVEVEIKGSAGINRGVLMPSADDWELSHLRVVSDGDCLHSMIV